MPRVKHPKTAVVIRGKIHRARLADLDALVELEASFTSDQLTRRSFRHLLTRGQADILVFRDNGQIVANAVILYRHNSTQARIYSLVVHPRCQGRGIAKALIQAAERAAKRRGCTHMSLEVRPDNEPALRLYTKLGYTVLGRSERYYEDGTAALHLKASLR